uniref:G-protein coupled receptors family 1 profile domain-containing protein n=1 Tax=Plectus sambesii TaxID=2011161 RepID=A0A914UJ58_9BILA
VFLAYMGGYSSALMNLVVSIDRYIAISQSLKYRSMGIEYANRMLAVVAIVALTTLSAMFLSSYFGLPHKENLDRMCTGLIFPAWFLKFHYSFVTGVNLLSITIYMGVYFFYRRLMKQTAPQSGSDDEVQRSAKQRRLTVTLGIITISTFIFYVCPTTVLAVSTWWSKPVPQQYTFIIAAMTRTCTLINFVIYVVRQREIRQGMWKLLTCRIYEDNHVTAWISNHQS